MRRTRIAHPDLQLFADWRHHAFVTDQTGEAITLDALHHHLARWTAGLPPGAAPPAHSPGTTPSHQPPPPRGGPTAALPPPPRTLASRAIH